MDFSRHFPTLFLHLEQVSRGVKFDPPGTLAHFDEIAKIIKDKCANVSIDAVDISAEMGKIFYFARIFEKVLNALTPKAFMLSVYYHPVGMAWMLASRWAGVKSVDLQHGRLGPHHGAYTQLTAAPRDGYHLLPDAVWCWGEQTKHDIEVDKNPACERHGGLIGGNVWLHKWRYGNTDGLEPQSVHDFSKQMAGKKKILVSLQPLDKPVDAVLLEAMKNAPPEWMWLLRIHPLRRHTAPEIESILNKNGISNFEIEQSTVLPLFSLLKLADHHVTEFSSVVIEAAAFNVCSTVIGDRGREIFAPQISAGQCDHAESSHDLLNSIAGNRADLSLSGGPSFICMDENAPDTALRALAAT